MERWWRGAALAWLAFAGTAGAAQVTALRVESGAGGATVSLSLSQPVRVAVHDVAVASGAVARVYVDFPRGTRLGRGVPRTLTLSRPVTMVRVGRGEGGVVRVVLELGAAGGYRVRRSARGLELSVAVAPPRDRPRADPGERPEGARLARAGETRPPRIVIDPGHGGHDPGAQGYVVEKDVTLAIARRLAGLLRERLGAETILTRSDDETLSLGDRTGRANSEGADLFVSIHANANPSGRLHGIETYYLDNAADRATIRLAALENGLDLLRPRGDGTDLRYILSDLVQVGKMDESIALARAVQRAVVGAARARYPYVADLGVKRGPFYVLVGAYMPCVLVETSFLAHPIEGRRLARVEYQATIAEGLASGVARFLADTRRARTL